MPEFVTVAYYNPTNPDHLFLKSRLEEEGIHCYITNQFAAFRRGGGRCELQISSADFDRAIPVLKETGFYNPKRIISSPSLKRLDEITKKIPGLKILSTEMRLLIITLLVVGTFSTVLYFQLQLSNEEIITKNSWCVEKIKHNGCDLPTRTTGLVIIENDDCREYVFFQNNDIVYLPGINSMAAKGKWIVYKNEISISEVDLNSQIFEGTYQIKFSDHNNDLILQSNHTVIYLHANPNKRTLPF